MWSRSHTAVASALTAVAVLFVVATGRAAAQAADAPAASGAPSATVLTRARVASFREEAGGQFYVRLKLMPRSKLPFTTQTFRVVDPSLLANIPDGASVKFSSRHVEGENVVTAIHMVDACARFQPCD